MSQNDKKSNSIGESSLLSKSQNDKQSNSMGESLQLSKNGTSYIAKSSSNNKSNGKSSLSDSETHENNNSASDNNSDLTRLVCKCKYGEVEEYYICKHVPNLFGRVLGPTIDETVLSSLQNIMQCLTEISNTVESDEVEANETKSIKQKKTPQAEQQSVTSPVSHNSSFKPINDKADNQTDKSSGRHRKQTGIVVPPNALPSGLSGDSESIDTRDSIEQSINGIEVENPLVRIPSCIAGDSDSIGTTDSMEQSSIYPSNNEFQRRRSTITSELPLNWGTSAHVPSENSQIAEPMHSYHLMPSNSSVLAAITQKPTPLNNTSLSKPENTSKKKNVGFSTTKRRSSSLCLPRLSTINSATSVFISDKDSEGSTPSKFTTAEKLPTESTKVGPNKPQFKDVNVGKSSHSKKQNVSAAIQSLLTKTSSVQSDKIESSSVMSGSSKTNMAKSSGTDINFVNQKPVNSKPQSSQIYSTLERLSEEEELPSRLAPSFNTTNGSDTHSYAQKSHQITPAISTVSTLARPKISEVKLQTLGARMKSISSLAIPMTSNQAVQSYELLKREVEATQVNDNCLIKDALLNIKTHSSPDMLNNQKVTKHPSHSDMIPKSSKDSGTQMVANPLEKLRQIGASIVIPITSSYRAMNDAPELLYNMVDEDNHCRKYHGVSIVDPNRQGRQPILSQNLKKNSQVSLPLLPGLGKEETKCDCSKKINCRQDTCQGINEALGIGPNVAKCRGTTYCPNFEIKPEDQQQNKSLCHTETRRSSTEIRSKKICDCMKQFNCGSQICQQDATISLPCGAQTKIPPPTTECTDIVSKKNDQQSQNQPCSSPCAVQTLTPSKPETTQTVCTCACAGTSPDPAKSKKKSNKNGRSVVCLGCEPKKCCRSKSKKSVKIKSMAELISSILEASRRNSCNCTCREDDSDSNDSEETDEETTKNDSTTENEDKKSCCCCCCCKHPGGDCYSSSDEDRTFSAGDCCCPQKEKGCPKETRYAVAKISHYDSFSTYEIMKSSKKKPRQMPNYIEGIFVIRKRKA